MDWFLYTQIKFAEIMLLICKLVVQFVKHTLAYVGVGQTKTTIYSHITICTSWKQNINKGKIKIYIHISDNIILISAADLKLKVN